MALAEPMPPPFSIESILPRDLAMNVIERYFEHVSGSSGASCAVLVP